MAVSSIQQILEFTQDSALQKILNKYIEQHTHLQQTAESQLSADGFEPKDPGMLASAFSWFTTEIKLGMNSDNSEIAKVLIDGCSMGIKTLEKLEKFTVDVLGEYHKVEKEPRMAFCRK